MQLALGTVQFGLPYGIVGPSDRIGRTEAREILARAQALGITRLDTAQAYGQIEEELPSLMPNRRFTIVSKIPKLPHNIDGESVQSWVKHVVETSQKRLGDMLCGLLFHDEQIITNIHFDRIVDELFACLRGTGIRTGLSTYNPDSIINSIPFQGCSLVQVPCNAYDQRLSGAKNLPGGIEISIRSIFLQGLLVVSPELATKKVPASKAWIQEWHCWARERGLTPLEAALAAAKSFQFADYCVVGVDSVEQFSEIANAWESSTAIPCPELAGSDPKVFDPRLWSRAES